MLKLAETERANSADPTRHNRDQYCLHCIESSLKEARA
jgi:hypothetical protein